MTQDPTEPLAATSSASAHQLRPGELAGRDLSARAFATLAERGAYDPQRHSDARGYQPLTTREQTEMLACGQLSPAITSPLLPSARQAPDDPGQRAVSGRRDCDDQPRVRCWSPPSARKLLTLQAHDRRWRRSAA